MPKNVVAYPHPTLAPESVQWDDWRLTEPTGTTLDNLQNTWDYGQDLAFESTVVLDADALVELLAGQDLSGTSVTAEVVCRASAWRTSVSVPLHTITPGPGEQLHVAVRVEVPGHRVDDQLQLTAYVLGPARTPSTATHTSGAKLAVGPTTRVVLRPDAAQLPVSIVSFEEVGWRAAPWRFVLQADSLRDTYSASVRLYVNADLAVADELTSSSGGQARERLLNTVRFDVLRSLMAQLHQLRSEPELSEEFDAVSEMDENSVGFVAEVLAQKHLGYGLSTALDRLTTAPVDQEQRLAAKVRYHGETRPE